MHPSKWRDLFGIKSRRRSKALSPTEPPTAEPSPPAESDTAQTTVVEAPQSSSLLTTDKSDPELPHVFLELSLGKSVHRGDGVMPEGSKLQQAYEELESVLQARNGPSASRPGLQEALTQVNSRLSRDALLEILEGVKMDRETNTRSASSKAGEFMQRLFPLSKIALGLTGSLADNFGYGPVQIATNGLAQLLELAISIPQDSEKALRALDALAADTRLLSELERLPETAVDEMLAVPAIELHYQLIVLLRKTIVWLDKGFFRKFAGSLVNPSQIKDAISELQVAREALTAALLSDTYLTVKWQQIATNNAETLNSLCPDDYHIAQLMRQKELHTSRLSNSVRWLVDDDRYNMWRAGDRRILWCPGLPGAGKTYLASRMIDDLESLLRGGNMGLAYVFCEVNRRGQQSEQRVIEAFTRQLMARKPELCQDLKSFLRDPLQTIGHKKALLKMVLSRFQGSFLILDALDEFSPDYIERHSLASSLKQIIEDCGDSTVRLCITSRESLGVGEVLCSDSKLAETLSVRSSGEDIRKLVESAYDRTASAIPWLKDNCDLKHLAIEKVIERSNCIFKLADLQIRSVLRSPSPKAMQQALDTLTTDVNDYYEKIIERIVTQKDTGRIVVDLLTWLTYARTPMHMHQLGFALGIEPGKCIGEDFSDQIVDLPRFISLSEGLVTVGDTGDLLPDKPETRKGDDSPEGPRVNLAHQSVREYLSTSCRWRRQDGEHFVLSRCLTAMTSPIFIGVLIHLFNTWHYAAPEEQSCGPRALKLFITVQGVPMKVPGFLLWAVLSWGQYLTPTTLDAKMKTMVEALQSGTDFQGNWKLHLHSLSNGKVFELPPHRFRSVLYWSAHEDWVLACKLLLPLESKPNVLFKVDNGGRSSLGSLAYFESAFSAAVRTGDLDLVTMFLDDPRVDPNQGKIDPFQGHITPVMWACKFGHRDMVKVLLARKDVDINVCDDKSKFGLGRPAIFQARASVFDLLLARQNFDVNLEHQGRRVIHHLAYSGGSPSFLEELLRNAGTDVNARTSERLEGMLLNYPDQIVFERSRTALMVASLVGNAAQVKVLSEHPNVEAAVRDDDGLTALMLSSRGWTMSGCIMDGTREYRPQGPSKQHSEVITILSNFAGNQVNEQDNLGRTALAHAAMCGTDPLMKPMIHLFNPVLWRKEPDKRHLISIMKRLLQIDGIEINITDKMGHAPLDYVNFTKGFNVRKRDYEIKQWADRFKRSEATDFVCHTTSTSESIIEELEEVKSHLLAAGAQIKKPIPLPRSSKILSAIASEYMRRTTAMMKDDSANGRTLVIQKGSSSNFSM